MAAPEDAPGRDRWTEVIAAEARVTVQSGGEGDEAMSLAADHLEFRRGEKVMHLDGNAVILRGEQTLSAEQAQWAQIAIADEGLGEPSAGPGRI